MLKTVEYLFDYGLDSLIEKYSIKIHRHNKYNNLILFKYNQIKSPKYEEITKECRGLILDELDNWKIINYPFNRFFNYGENESEKALDLSTTTAFHKEDGTLISLFWYREEWLVSTLGTADASGEVAGYNITYSDLFWQVFTKLKCKYPLTKNYTYIFELCTYKNKIILNYFEDYIYLIGRRNLLTLQETNQKYLKLYAELYNYSYPKIYNYSDISSLLNSSSQYLGTEFEGYVLVDKNFNRVKIKNKNYIKLHQLKNKINNENILLDSIRKNDFSEILIYFPEIETILCDLHISYSNLITNIKKIYNKYQSLNKKDFANKIKNYFYSPVLFALYNKKISYIEEYLVNMDIKKLYKWIKTI